MECVVEWSMDVRLSLKHLNEKQREFPAPPWAGVKLVRSAASHFFKYRNPYYSLEPTLSASQNPRTHFGVIRGAPGLCRAHVKGRTPTDTPATAATETSVGVALLMCSGVTGSTRVSPETSAGGIKIRHRSFRWLPARDHGEATGHRARGTSPR